MDLLGIQWLCCPSSKLPCPRLPPPPAKPWLRHCSPSGRKLPWKLNKNHQFLPQTPAGSGCAHGWTLSLAPPPWKVSAPAPVRSAITNSHRLKIHDQPAQSNGEYECIRGAQFFTIHACRSVDHCSSGQCLYFLDATFIDVKTKCVSTYARYRHANTKLDFTAG